MVTIAGEIFVRLLIQFVLQVKLHLRRRVHFNVGPRIEAVMLRRVGLLEQIFFIGTRIELKLGFRKILGLLEERLCDCAIDLWDLRHGVVGVDCGSDGALSFEENVLVRGVFFLCYFRESTVSVSG